MISVRGLLKAINKTNPLEKTSPVEQLELMTKYIADNMTDTEEDKAVLKEVIYAGKLQIAESTLESVEANEIGEYDFDTYNSKKENVELSKFIKNPVGTLTYKLRNIAEGKDTKNADEIQKNKKEAEKDLDKALQFKDKALEEKKKAQEDLDKANTQDEKEKAEDALYEAEKKAESADQFVKMAMDKIDNAEVVKGNNVDTYKYNLAGLLVEMEGENYNTYVYEEGKLANDKINLMKRLPEFKAKNPIQEALNKCNKKGFFEKMFNTTSKEYKAFADALKKRNDCQTTRDRVEDTAIDYLKHKIPGYNGEGLPNLEDIEKLSGVGKDRAMLAYNSLASIRDSETYEGRSQLLEQNAQRNINNFYEPEKVNAFIDVEVSKENNKEMAIKDISELEDNKIEIDKNDIQEDKNLKMDNLSLDN